MTPELVTETVMEWVETLDYEYMLLHIMLCYGIYYSDNMKWLSERFGGRSRAIWIVGAIIGLMEVVRFLPSFHGDGLDVQRVMSILHSYLVIQVFVEDIVRLVHNWIGVFRRTTNNLTRNSDEGDSLPNN